jgi:hypothetical protein
VSKLARTWGDDERDSAVRLVIAEIGDSIREVADAGSAAGMVVEE